MAKSVTTVEADPPKRVGIWIRVSTEDQARGESPAHHEQRARMLAQAKGWQVANLYDLSGVSGKTVMDHPECRRMLKDVASGAISALVFSKLARLARNTKELLEFAEYFGEHDADLISLGESIDTSTPAGRLFYTVIAAMAQWERDEISERVQASVPIRAKLGKSTGGKPALGYHWKDGKIVPHPDEAPVRRLIYELFAEHKRKKKVARILNERGFRTRQGTKFSDSTITRLLNDPTAMGQHRANYLRNMGKGKTAKVKPQKDWVFRPVEPIIDRELWDECQRILGEQEAGKTARRTPQHLFSGYVFCHCGERMYPKGKAGKYSCRKCSNKIPADDLEALFQEQLQAFFLSEEQLGRFLTEESKTIMAKQEEVNVLEREVKKLQADLLRISENLTASLTQADVDLVIQPSLKRLKELNVAWPKAQAELDLLKINQTTSEYVIAGARDLYSQWFNLSFGERRSVVEAIVETIVIGQDAVEINLHYIPDGPIGPKGQPHEPPGTGGPKGSKKSTETGGQKATNSHGLAAATSWKREG